MTEYTHAFIVSLVFTILTETLTLYFLIRRVFRIAREKIDDVQIALAGFIASAMTIPYVWYVFPTIANWSRSISLHYSEIFALFLEALFYKTFLKISTRNSVLISLVCNSVSFSLGHFLRFKGLWFY